MDECAPVCRQHVGLPAAERPRVRPLGWVVAGAHVGCGNVGRRGVPSGREASSVTDPRALTGSGRAGTTHVLSPFPVVSHPLGTVKRRRNSVAALGSPSPGKGRRVAAPRTRLPEDPWAVRPGPCGGRRGSWVSSLPGGSASCSGALGAASGPAGATSCGCLRLGTLNSEPHARSASAVGTPTGRRSRGAHTGWL